jgi:hypothetical protein
MVTASPTNVVVSVEYPGMKICLRVPGMNCVSTSVSVVSSRSRYDVVGNPCGVS